MNKKIIEHDCIIRNASCVRPEKTFNADIAIDKGKISKIIPDPESNSSESEQHRGKKEIDAKGLTLIPGVIDTQVHFREPGLTHKEDLESGSRAALLGGVTTFFEMPNTNPATTTVKSIQDKIERAHKTSWVDFAFFIGATGQNTEELIEATKLDHCCGVKIFLGSSTGDLLLYREEALSEIFQKLPKDVVIAVHSENEELLVKNKHIRDQATSVHAHPQWRSVEVALSSTKRIIQIARKNNRKLHILHISTAEEIDFLRENKDICTFEITPQHLTLAAPECYDQLGTYAQMNPPIREAYHRDKLWQAIDEGLADVIGSDHAPHTKEEKDCAYPQSPSGMPGVQTMLPLMLMHYKNKKIKLNQIVHYLCEAPTKLYPFLSDRGRIEEGLRADLVLLDLGQEVTLQNEQMASKCGWTPFSGMKHPGKIHTVITKGRIYDAHNFPTNKI